METTILNAISSVGFPIVACGFCGYYILKVQTQLTESVNKLSSVVEKNTAVMEELTQKLKGEKENGNT